VVQAGDASGAGALSAAGVQSGAGSPSGAGAPGAGQGVYAISVAAELAGVAPQTLRLYETKGLLEPHRTAGGTRRYSAADLARVTRILELTGTGVNLAGIAVILRLEDDNSDLRAQLDQE
jgi:MerR family transcriptional regulator/heat shock protein HspR